MKNCTSYERIRGLREDSDKKQSELADALYMKLTQYGRYERGEREIPLNVAVAIAEYYGVSLDYIVGLSNEKRPAHGISLTSEESEFIGLLRKLNTFERGQIFERINVILEKNKK